jgi:hypothetical protein
MSKLQGRAGARPRPYRDSVNCQRRRSTQIQRDPPQALQASELPTEKPENLNKKPIRRLARRQKR